MIILYLLIGLISGYLVGWAMRLKQGKIATCSVCRQKNILLSNKVKYLCIRCSNRLIDKF